SPAKSQTHATAPALPSPPAAARRQAVRALLRSRSRASASRIPRRTPSRTSSRASGALAPSRLTETTLSPPCRQRAAGGPLPQLSESIRGCGRTGDGCALLRRPLKAPEPRSDSTVWHGENGPDTLRRQRMKRFALLVALVWWAQAPLCMLADASHAHGS